MKTFFVVGMLHRWNDLEADSPWGTLPIGRAFGTMGFLPVFETREEAEKHNTIGAPIFAIQEQPKVTS